VHGPGRARVFRPPPLDPVPLEPVPLSIQSACTTLDPACSVFIHRPPAHPVPPTPPQLYQPTAVSVYIALHPIQSPHPLHSCISLQLYQSISPSCPSSPPTPSTAVSAYSCISLHRPPPHPVPAPPPALQPTMPLLSARCPAFVGSTQDLTILTILTILTLRQDLTKKKGAGPGQPHWKCGMTCVGGRAWGDAGTHTHMHPRTHAPTHARARAHTHTNTRTHTHAHARTHAPTHARTHTRHTGARTRTRMHTYARTRTRTHERTHARARAHTHTPAHPRLHAREHASTRALLEAQCRLEGHAIWTISQEKTIIGLLAKSRSGCIQPSDCNMSVLKQKMSVLIKSIKYY
jgi:hypothetical protein